VDTIAWCAAQLWCSGQVVTYGSSYLGHTQIYAAGGSPPALVAMSPGVVPSAPYDLTYNGGALLLASSLGWAMAQAGGKLFRSMAMGIDVSADLREWAETGADHWALCRRAPLQGIPILDRLFPGWKQWLDHPTNDGWWHGVDVQDRPTLPTYYTSGWWDLFLKDSLHEFNRQPRHPSSRMVIGPWSHIIEGPAHGEVYYGPEAGAAMQDLEGSRLAFLRSAVSPDAHIPDGPPVRLFVMGSNRWRNENEWPPTRARATKYFLHADGALSPSAPLTDSAPATFVFDPLDPVSTVAGRNLGPGSDGAHLTGPVDQRMLDGRADILRFTSGVLSSDVEVIGNLTVTLHAATSAVDTDWTAKLVDVWPDGRAFNVADGLIRARHRLGNDRTEFLPSGVAHRFDIDLIATAQTFLAGHRMRVDISSSNFPRYDRNPGTGGLQADVAESDFVSARQTVFLDAQRASWITLPIIED
jgi:uncharacterized protein